MNKLCCLLFIIFVTTHSNKVAGLKHSHTNNADGRDHAAHNRLVDDQEFAAFCKQNGFESAARQYCLFDSAYILPEGISGGENLYDVYKRNPGLRLVFIPLRGRWPARSPFPYTEGNYFLISPSDDTIKCGNYTSYWASPSAKTRMVIVPGIRI